MTKEYCVHCDRIKDNLPMPFDNGRDCSKIIRNCICTGWDSAICKHAMGLQEMEHRFFRWTLPRAIVISRYQYGCSHYIDTFICLDCLEGE